MRSFAGLLLMSGKDKGGPSKGGFLNNRLFSYTVLYLCNELNGVYTNDILFMKMIYYSGNTFTRTTFVLRQSCL